jgi:uncharacterized protein involved in outer membrane biogenesis
MKKNILIFAACFLILIALILYQLFANLDSIVAGVIEDVGTDVLKTDVRVSGVSIDLKGGKAAIAGMTIANPKGYSSAKLFELKDILVDLDLSSLGKDVLVIEAVRIQNPKINFEGDADGGSNMQTLMDNMNSGSADSGTKTEAEQTRMIISSFQMSDAQVKATTKMKPGEPMEIKLPAIKMSGIGKAQGGVTADVVAEEITTEMIRAVLKAAAKSGIEQVIEKKKTDLLDKLKGNN